MAAQERHWRSSWQGTRTNITWGAVALLLGIVMYAAVPILSVVLIAASLVLWASTLLRWWLYRSAFRRTPRFAEAMSLRISDEGIYVQSAEGESDVEWDTFVKYRETPTHFFLYTDPGHFSLVPKEPFETRDDERRFRQLLEEHVGGGKRWKA